MNFAYLKRKHVIHSITWLPNMKSQYRCKWFYVIFLYFSEEKLGYLVPREICATMTSSKDFCITFVPQDLTIHDDLIKVGE